MRFLATIAVVSLAILSVVSAKDDDPHIRKEHAKMPTTSAKVVDKAPPRKTCHEASCISKKCLVVTTPDGGCQVKNVCHDREIYYKYYDVDKRRQRTRGLGIHRFQILEATEQGCQGIQPLPANRDQLSVNPVTRGAMQAIEVCNQGYAPQYVRLFNHGTEQRVRDDYWLLIGRRRAGRTAHCILFPFATLWKHYKNLKYEEVDFDVMD